MCQYYSVDTEYKCSVQLYVSEVGDHKLVSGQTGQTPLRMQETSL